MFQPRRTHRTSGGISGEEIHLNLRGLKQISLLPPVLRINKKVVFFRLQTGETCDLKKLQTMVKPCSNRMNVMGPCAVHVFAGHCWCTDKQFPELQVVPCYPLTECKTSDVNLALACSSQTANRGNLHKRQLL